MALQGGSLFLVLNYLFSYKNEGLSVGSLTPCLWGTRGQSIRPTS